MRLNIPISITGVDSTQLTGMIDAMLEPCDMLEDAFKFHFKLAFLKLRPEDAQRQYVFGTMRKLYSDGKACAGGIEDVMKM